MQIGIRHTELTVSYFVFTGFAHEWRQISFPELRKCIFFYISYSIKNASDAFDFQKFHCLFFSFFF